MNKEEIKQYENRLSYYKDIRAKIKDIVYMCSMSDTGYKTSSLGLTDLRLLRAIEEAITDMERKLGQ